MQRTDSGKFTLAKFHTKFVSKLLFIYQSKLAFMLSKRWLPLIVLAAAATITLVVVGQTSTPIAINLSSDPLFSSPTSDKPTMALALSVEFPTVGAQYRDSNNYSNTNEYLGYYDAESCYTYNDTPIEVLPLGKTLADYKRFDRKEAAIALSLPDTLQLTKTSRKCVNAFSGNFLNWASSSSIDMLRLALSGGDRIIDTAGTSV